ncbi:MAG: hypothetical protein ACYC0V_11910 [Armatimonadota bacterium]
MRVNQMNRCLGIAGIFLMFRLIIAMVPPAGNQTHSLFIYAIYFVTIAITMLLQLGMVVSLAGLKLPAKKSALISFVALCIFIGITFLLMKTHISIPFILALTMAIRDMSLMIFAAALGCIISFIIKEPNIVVPVALFAAVVDYWGVTSGPLSVVLAKRPAILDVVSVHMPVPIVNAPGTLIGLGDFVFLGIFFSILYRFALNTKLSFWLGYAFLTVTMFIVTAVDVAIPALVPIGAAIIIANYKAIELKRDEKLATLYVGIIIFAALIILKYQVFKSLF